MKLVIEYVAEPLPGNRAQLRKSVFVNGVQHLELSHDVGSPAPREAVEAAARVLTWESGE